MTIGSRWLAIAAIAVVFPARAGVSPNGMGSNGMGSNGMGSNGMGSNGMGSNGLGFNGMGSNGMGSNGMGSNGLDVNGMGSNGLDLGPNGVIYLITPDGSQPSTFREWFEVNPPERSAWMRYFARCAYDASTAIAYLDSTGKTWVWTGQYGLAMGSLSSGETATLATGETVRKPMTEEEGKWVSACLLAHVNTKGTHQYISVRLPADEPAPCPAAASALGTTPEEEWAFASIGYGQFFADLYTAEAGLAGPQKYACLSHWGNPSTPLNEAVLGRTCDTTDCTYLDEQGTPQHVLTAHLGVCTDPLATEGGPWPHTPDYFLDSLVVFGPRLAEMEWAWTADNGREISAIDVGMCSTGLNAPYWCTTAEAAFTKRIDISQKVTCLHEECLGAGMGEGPPPSYVGASAKVVGLTPDQAIDTVLRNSSNRAIDPSRAFTAIVRYTKARTGAVNVWGTQQDGSWRDFTHLEGYWDPKPIPGSRGPDVWSATGSSDQFEWMQIWPVYAAPDAITSGGTTAVKLRLSGATMGTSCTGPKVLKGEGEPGACQSWTVDRPQRRYVCDKQGEIGVPCRGSLVLPFGKGAKWHCVGDGDPVYACTAADAPDLDGAGFVPGRPWCAPADATSFLGVCH